MAEKHRGCSIIDGLSLAEDLLVLEWVPILAGDAIGAAILVHAQLGERAKGIELIERSVSELPRARVHTVEWEEFPTVGGNLTHSIHDE